MSHSSAYWYNYTVLNISDENDVAYQAVIPKFPKMYIVGESPEQLSTVVPVFIQEAIERYQKEGRSIPAPDMPIRKYSGTFTFRTSPSIHSRLAELATAENRSINSYLEDLVKEKVC